MFEKAILTVAGFDPSGGAGILADMRTFGALGAWGVAAVAALTIQDSRSVSAIRPVSPSFLRAELASLAEAYRLVGAKTGLLSTPGLIAEAARFFARSKLSTLVVDPVLFASSGRTFLSPRGISALKHELLPLAAVVTLNIPEAEILTAAPAIDTVSGMQRAAERIARTGCRSVVIKGGHYPGEACDLVFDGERFILFTAPKITGKKGRGTGCIFSAAVAARLASGTPLEEAVVCAKRIVHAALASAPGTGKSGGGVPLLPSPSGAKGKSKIKRICL